jgi:hypothetical protein
MFFFCHFGRVKWKKNEKNQFHLKTDEKGVPREFEV